MIPWFFEGTALVVGAVIGSFLNVAIHRLPRDESVVFPSSRCPRCETPIAPYDNIPILSYLWLRGRCRHCRGVISPRYPIVEAANALLYLLIVTRFGVGPEALVWAFYCSALIVITGIDLDHKLIPDVITLPGMALGLAASLFMPLTFRDSLIALLAGGGFFYAVAVASDLILRKPGMGGGDIKLTAMMGSFLGIEKLAFAVFAALLTGSLTAIVLMAMGRKTRKDVIPFGPFLALGGVTALFWGDAMIEWYLRMSSF